jgi:hypothetical protein
MCNSAVRFLLIFSSRVLSYPVLAANTEITRIIRDGNIEIEAFTYGEGSETLIIAAGNGRPAAQLEELARDISARGLQVVTYNYRTIGGSNGRIDGIRTEPAETEGAAIPASPVGQKETYITM